MRCLFQAGVPKAAFDCSFLSVFFLNYYTFTLHGWDIYHPRVDTGFLLIEILITQKLFKAFFIRIKFKKTDVTLFLSCALMNKGVKIESRHLPSQIDPFNVLT